LPSMQLTYQWKVATGKIEKRASWNANGRTLFLSLA
jgi:hypothetical protein